jgi:hypothetical protein
MDAAKRVTRLLRQRQATPPAEPPALDDRPLLDTPYELGGRDEPLPLGIHRWRLYQQGAPAGEGEVSLSLTWPPHEKSVGLGKAESGKAGKSGSTTLHALYSPEEG